jgi:hypothetical protein
MAALPAFGGVGSASGPASEVDAVQPRAQPGGRGLRLGGSALADRRPPPPPPPPPPPRAPPPPPPPRTALAPRPRPARHPTTNTFERRRACGPTLRAEGRAGQPTRPFISSHVVTDEGPHESRGRGPLASDGPASRWVRGQVGGGRGVGAEGAARSWAARWGQRAQGRSARGGGMAPGRGAGRVRGFCSRSDARGDGAAGRRAEAPTQGSAPPPLAHVARCIRRMSRCCASRIQTATPQ